MILCCDGCRAIPDTASDQSTATVTVVSLQEGRSPEQSRDGCDRGHVQRPSCCVADDSHVMRSDSELSAAIIEEAKTQSKTMEFQNIQPAITLNGSAVPNSTQVNHEFAIVGQNDNVVGQFIL